MRPVPTVRAGLRKGRRDQPRHRLRLSEHRNRAALAAAGQVTSIPTLMVFKSGHLILYQPGALPAAALDPVIAGARALDVEQARQQAAGQR